MKFSVTVGTGISRYFEVFCFCSTICPVPYNDTTWRSLMQTQVARFLHVSLDESYYSGISFGEIVNLEWSDL